jgi:hypothetical protein
MSGTLTAVALLLGAGMASGAGMLASKMAQPSTEPESPPPEISSYARDLAAMPAPSEASTPPSEPAPVDPAPVDQSPAPVDPAPVDQSPAPVDQSPAPVDQSPAPVDQSPAPVEPTGATAPTLPAQPGDDMAGGAIGRPPWGAISKSVIQPALPGSVTSTVTNALGLPTSQKELEGQLISVNEQLRIVNLEKVELGDDIKENGKIYKKLMGAFATMNEQVKDSNKNNTLITYWTQKLNPKSNTLGKEERRKLEEEKKSETDPTKKAAIQAKLDNSGKQKDIDPEDAADWSGKLADAMSAKSMADFKKEEANRDVVKYKAKVDEIRTQVDQKDKLIKELITKRDAILIQIQNLVIQTKKTPLSRDWPERMQRYADAVQRLKTAEVNFSAFVTEVWLPAKERGQEKEYQDTYNARKKIYDDARAEMVVARSKLTENTMSSMMSGSNKFDAFVGEISEITQNAVDSNNNIKTNFAYNTTPVVPVLGRGYSTQVKKLVDFASKDRLKAVADIYYDISKQDTAGLQKNIKQYTEFFDKIKGSLKRASDRVLRKGKIGFEITQEVLREFVQRQLSLAYNDVRYLPQIPIPATQNSVDVYTKIRKATTEFIDEQIFTINKMMKVIADAKRKNPNDSKIKLLSDQVKSLFTLPPANFPPPGMCSRTFKPSTFKYLSTGLYNDKKVEKILEGETPIKQQFLDEIGYTYVSNFSDAKALLLRARVIPTNPAELLLRRAALNDYAQYMEQLAFRNPGLILATILQERDGSSNAARQTIDHIFNIHDNQYFLNIPTVRAENPFAVPFPVAGTGREVPVPVTTFANDLRGFLNRNETIPDPTDPAARAFIKPKFTSDVYLQGIRTNAVTGNPMLEADNTTPQLVPKPISVFKDACEIDGNVGRGPEESTQILRLLDMISNIDIESETPKSELLTLVEKLEKDGKVNIRRPDQSRVDNTLATKGFIDLPNWTIMKVSDDPGDNDFVMTFLMLRSGKFKSIPYDERTTYNGKTSNARKVYARLAKAEILKLPEFKGHSGDFKEEDWGKISDAFNIGIVIFKKIERRAVAVIKYDDKVGVPTFYVYMDADNNFSPVRLQPFGGPRVGVPAMEPGAAGPAVRTAERNIYSAFGGNIQGPELGSVESPEPSVLQGGQDEYDGGKRHKTWRRSMPTRYTRRKI